MAPGFVFVKGKEKKKPRTKKATRMTTRKKTKSNKQARDFDSYAQKKNKSKGLMFRKSKAPAIRTTMKMKSVKMKVNSARCT